jgi:predicted aspartyl protease
VQMARASGLPGLRAILTALLLTGATARPAAAKCQLQQVASLPVRVTADRVLLDARIEGKPAEVILDTGAQTSLIFPEAARHLGLPITDAYGTGTMFGAGGSFSAHKVRIHDLTIGGTPLHDVVFWVGGGAMERPEEAMLLGQDVLRTWDVEYDLGHGVVRLFHPVDCHGDDVAYWAQSYARSVMHPTLDNDAVIDVDVLLNGARASATLDTGAPRTVVTPEAAARARAAVKRDTHEGETVGGLGAYKAAAGYADFDTVGVGGEVLKHVRLQVADMFAHNRQETTGHLAGVQANMPDLLLGLDFMRAHRLIVAPDQGVIYFTYEGGPAFAPAPGGGG